MTKDRADEIIRNEYKNYTVEFIQHDDYYDYFDYRVTNADVRFGASVTPEGYVIPVPN